MGQKIDGFDWENKREPKAYEQYDKYFDGNTWKIDLDEFPNHSSKEGLRSAFVRRAKDLGITIRTKLFEDTFVLQKVSDSR